MISYLFLLLIIGLSNATMISIYDSNMKIQMETGPCCYFTDLFGQTGICCNFEQKCRCDHHDCFCVAKTVKK